MPSTIGSKSIAKLADIDLSTHRNKFVKFTATGCTIAGVGDRPHGILLNAPTAGQVAEVALESGKVKTSGAITAGDSIECGALGVAVTAAGVNPRVALAENTTASGDLAAVMIDLHS